VPFSAVARAVSTPGFASIDRIDRKRTVTVTADVDREHTTPDRLVGELDRTLLPALVSRHPGVSYSFGGQQRDQRETLGFLVRTLLLVSVLMYALMAIPLRSYTQPLLIVLAVPVGLVGAIWGHALLGMSLSILSFVGMIAVSGVVVNDALLLLDAVNRRLARGLSLPQSLMEATATRFAPIAMTTAATSAALLPLLFDTSAEAQWLRPMAVSLVFGEVISTAVILVLIPATSMILDDLGRLGRADKKRSSAPEAEPLAR
jgi:multidrug efflux pump subunit AcrB